MPARFANERRNHYLMRSRRFVFSRFTPLSGLRTIRCSETAQFMQAVTSDTASPRVESPHGGLALIHSVRNLGEKYGRQKRSDGVWNEALRREGARDRGQRLSGPIHFGVSGAGRCPARASSSDSGSL